MGSDWRARIAKALVSSEEGGGRGAARVQGFRGRVAGLRVASHDDRRRDTARHAAPGDVRSGPQARALGIDEAMSETFLRALEHFDSISKEHARATPLGHVVGVPRVGAPRVGPCRRALARRASAEPRLERGGGPRRSTTSLHHYQNALRAALQAPPRRPTPSSTGGWRNATQSVHEHQPPYGFLDPLALRVVVLRPRPLKKTIMCEC